MNRNYNSAFSRILYDSPLHTLRGKIILAAIVLPIIILGGHTWLGWLTPLQSGWILFFGLFSAFLGSLLGLVFLRYLDRREPESWGFFLGVLLLAILITAAPAAFINERSPVPLLTVGINEEFWKVVPLLLLVFFAPTTVTGVRDGLIYGALGGFGFNIIETAAYILRTTDPGEGLAGTTAQLSRLGFWGLDNHVFWSMLVGAGIGLAVQSSNRRTKILAPLGAYLLAALTHTIQDFGIGGALAAGLLLVILAALGVKVTTQADQAATAELGNQYMGLALALESLVINFINIPILIYALLKSGNWERQIIRERLADEVGTVITPAEYEGVKAEKRFRLRRVPGYSRRVGRAIRNAQNNLAFHKEYLKRKNRPIEGDPLAEYYRAEVARFRGQ